MEKIIFYERLQECYIIKPKKSSLRRIHKCNSKD